MAISSYPPFQDAGDRYALDFDDDEKTDPCNMVAIVGSQESSVSGLTATRQGISDEIGSVVTPDCLMCDSDDE